MTAYYFEKGKRSNAGKIRQSTLGKTDYNGQFVIRMLENLAKSDSIEIVHENSGHRYSGDSL